MLSDLYRQLLLQLWLPKLPQFLSRRNFNGKCVSVLCFLSSISCLVNCEFTVHFVRVFWKYFIMISLRLPFARLEFFNGKIFFLKSNFPSPMYLILSVVCMLESFVWVQFGLCMNVTIPDWSQNCKQSFIACYSWHCPRLHSVNHGQTMDKILPPSKSRTFFWKPTFVFIFGFVRTFFLNSYQHKIFSRLAWNKTYDPVWVLFFLFFANNPASVQVLSLVTFYNVKPDSVVRQCRV